MMKSRSAAAALVAVLVIGLVSLILVLSISENTIGTLELQSNNQESARSYYLAESCLEESLARLEQDLSFTSVVLNFSTGRSCSVAVSGSNPKTIDVSTTVDGLSEDYRATASYSTSGTVNNFTLSSWAELP